MKNLIIWKKNEDGFVLITSMLIMLVLTIIGIIATNNSTTELRISGNDRRYKEAFYEADGGTQFGAETLEQNVACITGFNPGISPRSVAAVGNDPLGNPLPAGSVVLDNNITIIDNAGTGDTAFWRNNYGSWEKIIDPGGAMGDDWKREYPNDINRDFYFLANAPATTPRTNIGIEGDTKLTTGAAIQMAAGYEGKGKGISLGGSYMHYFVHAQHIGTNNSEAEICIQWRHMIGQEGDCYY